MVADGMVAHTWAIVALDEDFVLVDWFQSACKPGSPIKSLIKERLISILALAVPE